MRLLASICLCLLFGFFLGRWAPQGDLERVRKQVADLEKLVKEGGGGGGRANPLAGVGSILRIQERPAAPPASTNLVSASTNATATATNAVVRAERRRDRENLRARLDEAKELWSARSELARASFLEKLPKSDAHSRDFDVLVAAMNLKMEQRINDWVDRVKQDGKVRPEDGARLMNTLTGAIVETYDEFDRKLPPDWRQAAGDEFMLFDFVNPSVGEKFIEVEGLMNESGRSF